MKLVSSPHLEALLENMGIHSYLDVVSRLPRKYDLFIPTPINQLHHLIDKQKVVLVGVIITPARTRRFSKASLTSFYFREENTNTDFSIEAWNRPYLGKTIKLDSTYTLQGSYDAKGHVINLIALKSGKIDAENALVPVYSLPSDYPEHSYRQLVAKSLEESKGALKDILPLELKNKYRLPSRFDAYRMCHFPKSMEDVRQGIRLLKYEEALLFSLRNQIIRNQNKSLIRGARKDINVNALKEFIYSLPFKLTDDQKKAVGEALADMRSPSLMYRLLQGDVGTGKTMVAALLLYANYLRNEQGALLAPTDSLARQHFETLSSLFASTNIRLGLLVGNLDQKAHRDMQQKLESGEIDIAIGTHALFSPKVQYQNLGLAIIDEQHKFGVNQRSTLAEKGEHADVLLMSATPIPRTLSLTIYGDLDVSILSEFPSKQRNVLTKIVKSDSKEMMKAIGVSLTSDHRVYIVAPQIDGGDDDFSSAIKVFESYSNRFPGLVDLLHGKLSNEEKESAIRNFKDGVTPILVSTSVVEVGIDVKKANLMIIYDPTHFALSSLHQLRGRIGRDGSFSHCYLVYDHSIQEDLDKLNVLVSTDDGFKIAEEDLKRRGPGEITGIRQSGLPDFHYVNIMSDIRMLECARDDASYVLKNLSDPDCHSLEERAKKMTQLAVMA